jgi:two-component system sensor histidine kinase CpxA
MRSLTLRFFLSFWLIIVVLTGLAAVAGYAYSERMREAFDNFEVSDMLLAASEVLEREGRDGLSTWLGELPTASPVHVFIVDGAGKDLLGRRVPPWAERLMRRFEGRRRSWRSAEREPPNLRAARPMTRLRGPDGSIYTLFVEPKRDPYREWIGGRAGPVFLLVAVLLSAAVSFLLARAIAGPVRTLRGATVAIAEGRLDTRIDPAVRRRRDEIGLLANDLDAMARKLAQASTQQRELTRNVSHELRSPLARLRVALELARRQAGDLGEFRRIDVEAERLDELIGQLLEYSRLEAGTGAEAERIELDELLGQIVDDTNFECRSAGLDNISVDLSRNDAATITGRRLALASAFENVLRNAIHHSPPGTAVTVRSVRSGDQQIITVEDSGRGVAETDLDRLFEPFFRTADKMASGARGTGLGLAIAARAIEDSGGSIRAGNRQAGGLAIRIVLPVG